ncbi:MULTISPECIES: gamma-glutamylcysteine synthetase [unclassified Streptococcus]|uniref:gamma-glutamylcysteine synthetase n=1 Tax=unclassified Streptococcus TaxID=2608887 RepID=UPI0018AC8533|nr:MULTISPECIES: gamma-glutamylcysteine synthetase [unclassified Streptococcus]MBF8970380.1 gamma-glutamylcysteine synthetase [Streptococcus sp. NLN76]MBG9367586.1 gamma-glutamylcysteine synthetase [Streptococcus sp. NLN64]
MHHFFHENYLSKLKENPELFIGIELEFPIVQVHGQATDHSVSISLLHHLVQILEFTIVKVDEQDQPIEIVAANGDVILFEVSYNTLEFAFAKSENLFGIANRFQIYLEAIQSFLLQYDHQLLGSGINPNWAVNDNRPVATGRYQMLMDYLALGANYVELHPYLDYAAYICGSQVQFDVSRSRFLRVLNAFNKIEAAKAYLFANSSFEPLKNCALARDSLWEDSMHGLIPQNVGIYPSDFESEEDYIDFKSQSSFFYTERDGTYYYFEPIPLQEYLQKDAIRAYGLDGKRLNLKPDRSDLKNHRSYHYQELTKRGTVEFRSICTQPLEATFAPAAFHLGLLTELEALEDLLDHSPFFELMGRDYAQLRKDFSRQDLNAKEKEAIRAFSQELISCAKRGLQQRGLGEEIFLANLRITK